MASPWMGKLGPATWLLCSSVALGVGACGEDSAGSVSTGGRGAGRSDPSASGGSAGDGATGGSGGADGSAGSSGASTAGGGAPGDPIAKLWAWEQIDEPGPPAMFLPEMIYDSALWRIVLFGQSPDGASHLWVRTDAGWSPLEASGDVPPAGGSMAFDSARGRAVYLGEVEGEAIAQTWELEGDVWSRVETTDAPERADGAAMAFDPLSEVMVLFGGRRGTGGSNETWEYDGIDWRRIDTAALPRRRIHAGLVFDPVRERIVMFGGGMFGDRADATDFADTWEYDGSDWIDLTGELYPPNRSGMGLIYSPTHQRLFLYGGGGYLSLFDHRTVNGDAWILSGSSWRDVSDDGSHPPARWGHGMVYDLERERAVVFGGTEVGGWLWTEPAPAIDEIWEVEL